VCINFFKKVNRGRVILIMLLRKMKVELKWKQN